mmetsp:Transcript_10134/g.18285  ORF Transcript_10134/g.18285 Transcript_10134/m.18285 type:complete len:476 (+) Transcript_10134:43-1470(+)
MTKIEEPATVLVAPRKKRSWSTTLHSRTTLFRHDDGGGTNINPHPGGIPHPLHHPRRDRDSTDDDAKGTTEAAPPSHHQMAGQMDMQSILERYHSLALTHHTQTKRRRLESAARSTQNSQRLEQLTTLHKMAQDTLNFCTKVLRSEEHLRRENERERREVEEEMRRAEREKALAEEFLSRFAGSANHHRHHHALYHAEGRMNHAENIENEGQHSRRIGGIPSKFLDLSHFPKLRKSFHEGKGAKHDVFSPETDGKQTSRPIIDCTEESASLHCHSNNSIGGPSSHFPMRIPSFGGVPQEVALTGNTTQSKQNTKRIYISNASLSHVNGTYIQEGCYNDAPLFVRVGPPRKFMGKWDCSVVLRREKEAIKGGPSGGGGGGEIFDYIWKIGLVPAHRITHPRTIGYYMANEDSGRNHHIVASIPKRVSNVDRMEEDDAEESMYFEPPVEGWRVFQETAGVGSNTLGRASSLMVSYEE